MPDVLASMRAIAARLEQYQSNSYPILDVLMATPLVPELDLKLEDLQRAVDAPAEIYYFATSHGTFTDADYEARNSFFLLLAAANNPDGMKYWIERLDDNPRAISFPEMTGLCLNALSNMKKGPYYKKRNLPQYPLPSLAKIVEHNISSIMTSMRSSFELLEPIFDVEKALSFTYTDYRKDTYQLVCRPQTDYCQLALDEIRYDTKLSNKMMKANLKKTGGHVLQYEFGPDHPTDPGKPVFYIITNPYLEMAHGAQDKAYIDPDIMYDTTRTVGAKIAGHRRTLKTLQEFSEI